MLDVKRAGRVAAKGRARELREQCSLDPTIGFAPASSEEDDNFGPTS